MVLAFRVAARPRVIIGVFLSDARESLEWERHGSSLNAVMSGNGRVFRCADVALLDSETRVRQMM